MSATDKGLNQDDFRKLLQTPRPGEISSKVRLGGLGLNSRIPLPLTPKVTFAKTADNPPPKFKRSQFKKPAEVDEVASNDNKYRDRAAERRKGANPDYQETEQILKALNKSESLEAKTIYEQSKYLGGDTEHTHLVKGLDFALLAKVRNELQQEDPSAEGDQELELVLERIKEESEEKPRINSKFAQNIYDVAVVDAQKKPPEINDLFVAGRMAYIFELADEAGDYGDPFAIPTTVIRSKADVGDAGAEDNSTNDLVIEKISRVMAYVRKGERSGGVEVREKKLKKKLKEKQVEEVQIKKIAAIDESEDIFADAGRDYDAFANMENTEMQKEDEEEDEPVFIGPIFPGALPNTNKAELEQKVNYFSDSIKAEYHDPMDIDRKEEKETELSLNTLIEQAAEGVKEMKDSLFLNEKINETKASSKSEEIRKKLMGHDSYEGDYSTYGLSVGNISGTRESAYDSGHSDSDSDGTGLEHTIRDQGVTKNKKAQLSRWDFDTEEEWQAYKDNVTAMPKSAFQFGVKTGDGRKTRRSGKELTEKQKIDRDWQKISRIMEQKYGDDDGPSKKKKKQ
ncbi:hypothetical protein G9A89_005452 [Geosiphon pyriformis]|nr:hypothetical protein G9A89_005452 [Geosiphon pyriformis]